jgi:hypothetical protein
MKIYGDIAQQGLNQGMLWIKVVEAVGLELEENPAAGTKIYYNTKKYR